MTSGPLPIRSGPLPLARPPVFVTYESRGRRQERRHRRLVRLGVLGLGSLVVVLVVALAVAVAGWLRPSGVDVASAARGGALTPTLTSALEQAAQDAADDGVVLTITSGRRTVEEQQRLWEAAVAEHGSEQEARRWVLPPAESSHVTGEAVDVDGPSADWLLQHGWVYGLCQTYANEWWHLEAVGTPGQPCPAPRPDAAG